MKVYCSVPIRGEIKFQSTYNEIINFINSLGHEALCELNEEFKSQTKLSDKEIYLRDINWLDESDFVIAEVSGASTGIGFEISYALFEKKIPVLAASKKDSGSISAMISGCNNKLIELVTYDSFEELKNIISDFLNRHKSG